MLETLDYTIRNGSTPIFLYFDLYQILLIGTMLTKLHYYYAKRILY